MRSITCSTPPVPTGCKGRVQCFSCGRIATSPHIGRRRSAGWPGGRHVPFAVTGDGNLSAVFTLPACRCRGASRLPQEQRRCALPSGGHGNPPPGCGMDTVGKGQRRAQGKAPAQGRPLMQGYSVLTAFIAFLRAYMALSARLNTFSMLLSVWGLKVA